MRAIVLLATVVIMSVACQPAATLTPAASPTPTPTATPTPRLPTPTPDPEAALEEARFLMLELINKARADAGVPPVELGDNRAAQIHAENLAEACAGGHWGLDGTKPGMRYSLADGYQVNAENVSAIPWCEDSRSSAALQVRDAIEGWLASTGHQVVMLDRVYRKVNVGLAFNDNGYLVAVQQFEGDYVEYSVPPHIEGGLLQLEGRLRNQAMLRDLEELEIQVWYDKPPKPATAGQIAQTYCVDPGRQVASIRPLPKGRDSVRWKPFHQPHLFCKTPHHFPVDTPAPATREEAIEIRRAARARMAARDEVELQVKWIAASTWRTGDQEFVVTADLDELIREHGAGVYEVALWTPVNGETVVVAEPPEGYGPR